MELASLNPYSPGGAITDSSGYGFYGREDIFQLVRSAIQARQRTPIILYGQRRIGKSSVLRQIPYRLPSHINCVYYDLQGKAGMQLDQVLYGLAREIAQALKIPRPEREEAGEETFATEFLSRAVQALDDQPERLVLLFDEFDVLDERIAGADVAARRFMGYLSNLINQQPQVGYIMVVGRKTEELSQEFHSTLLKNAVQQRIGRLERKHTDDLVCGLARMQDFLHFSQDALDRIYSLTAGHPYCTQLLCFTIWRLLSIDLGPSGVEVRPSLVEDAVLPALEHGTHGLNWIFDGLTIPAYRLFLSALAETSNPLYGKPAPFPAIERALLSRQVAVDTVEFSRAPKDLERWDVITREQAGFRFQVPLIGVWIRRERPLEVLEKEVRYTNPRAYAYYELARSAHEAGDLDRAISDYRGALEASPYFFEAQRDLAIALREKGPDDLEATIEAYERGLELDSEMPISGLIQALLDALEDTETKPDKAAVYYERLGELDIDGKMKPRAARILRDRASQMMEAEWYREAETLFLALGEDDLAEQARKRRRNALWLGGAILLSGLAAFLMRIISSSSLGIELRALLWALVGGSLGSFYVVLFPIIESRRSTLRHKPFFYRSSAIPSLLRLLFSVTTGFGIGFLYRLLFGGDTAYQFAAFFSSLYAEWIIGGFFFSR